MRDALESVLRARAVVASLPVRDDRQVLTEIVSSVLDETTAEDLGFASNREQLTRELVDTLINEGVTL